MRYVLCVQKRNLILGFGIFWKITPKGRGMIGDKSKSEIHLQ